MTRPWLPLLLFGLGCAACTAGGAADAHTEGDDDPPAEIPVPATSPPTTVAVSPPTTPTTTTASSTTTSAVAPPAFRAAVRTATAEDLGDSWRSGCPVPIDDLRWVELAHWDSDGSVAEGVLVVHADHADDVVTVFSVLFDAGFPIHSMRPITEFASDDNQSMAANNSSAFNCREISGRPGVWSQHAYGGAIDINPLVNPWVRGRVVDPPGGADHLERDPATPGLIVAGDVVTEAFAAIGWGWGGDWSSSLDYQHFSHNGR